MLSAERMEAEKRKTMIHTTMSVAKKNIEIALEEEKRIALVEIRIDIYAGRKIQNN